MTFSFCVNSLAAAATTTTATETTAATAARETSADTSNTQATGASYGTSKLSGAPDIVAESAVVMDAGTGTVLYGKEASTKRYPASITKVMTALLAVENCNMSDIITYSNDAVFFF